MSAATCDNDGKLLVFHLLTQRIVAAPLAPASSLPGHRNGVSSCAAHAELEEGTESQSDRFHHTPSPQSKSLEARGLDSSRFVSFISRGEFVPDEGRPPNLLTCDS